MAVITTYVCDVSGKQGNQEDFFEVKVTATPSGKSGYYSQCSLLKLVHKDIAEKLHLVVVKENPPPELTLESKLMVLLKDYIADIAYEAGAEAAAHRN